MPHVPNAEPQSPPDALTGALDQPIASAKGALCDLAAYGLLGSLAVAQIIGYGSAELGFTPWDHARDAGGAHEMLAGRFFSDSALLGEVRWYNPVIQLLIAIASFVLGERPLHVAAHYAPVIGLAAPLGLYALAKRLMPPSSALIALVAFLAIIPGTLPFTAAPTYTPTMMPIVLTQGICLFGLSWVVRALETPSRLRAFAVSGALGAMVFLTQTGHGFVFAATLVVLLALSFTPLAPSSFVAARKGLALSLALTLLGFIAHILPLALRYGLTIVNDAPQRYEAPAAGYLDVKGYVIASLTAALLVTGYGALSLWKNRRIFEGWWLVVAAVVAAAALTFHGHLASYLHAHGTNIPVVVPTMHFLVYLKAFQALFFAIGFAELFGLLRWRVSSRLAAPVLQAAVLIAWTGYYVPHIAQRERSRLAEVRQLEARGVPEAARWIEEHTALDDVFLTTRQGWSPEYIAVVGAGRKMVATQFTFSNPFVDFDQREADRVRMLDAFVAGDRTLAGLAEGYQVRYTLVHPPLPADKRALHGSPVFENEFATIYRQAPITSR